MTISSASSCSDNMLQHPVLASIDRLHSRGLLVFQLLMIGSILSGVVGCFKGSNAMVELPPPPVVVAHPLKQPFREFVEENGSVEAAQTAEVRSRVQGFLEKVDFEPGQAVSSGETLPDGTVQAGDLLFLIEPDKYRTIYDSAKSAEDAAAASVVVAEAEVQLANATLRQTEKEKERQTQLRQSQAVSAAEYEAALAAFQSAQANVAAANAAVQLAEAELAQARSTSAKAKLDLDYTQVRAPISGRVSEPLIKLGNLVEDGSHLADITNTSDVFVNFSVNDREALRFAQQQRQRGISSEQSQARWGDQAVYLATEIDEGFPYVGVLDYVDQTGVDPATGTLSLRARFSNPDGLLLPGTFVRLRIASATTTEVIMLPDTCVLRDSKRTYVLTVDAENIVSETAIKISKLGDGWAIVSAGIDESMLVIVEGIQKAQKDKPVAPKSIELQPTGFGLEHRSKMTEEQAMQAESEATGGSGS